MGTDRSAALGVAWLGLTLIYRQRAPAERSERWAARGLLLLVGLCVLFIAMVTAWVVFKFARSLGADSPAMAGLYITIGLFYGVVFALLGVAEHELGTVDLSRLFHLPISPRALVAGSLLSRALSPQTVTFAVPAATLVGVALSQGHPGRALVMALSSALAGAHLVLLTLATSLLAASGRRSRRSAVRTLILSSLLLTVFGVMKVLGVELPLPSVEQVLEWLTPLWPALRSVLLAAPVVSALAWHHTGWLAPAYLLIAALEATLLVQTLTRVQGELMVGGGARESEQRIAAARPLGAWPLLSAAMRRTVRDVEELGEVLLLGPLILLVGLLLADRAPDLAAPVLLYLAPLVVPMLLKDRMFNILCREGAGLTGLLLTPYPRWRLLAQLNLVSAARVVVVMTVPAGLLLWLGEAPTAVASCLALALSMACLLLGAGNLVSVTMPVPMTRRRNQLVAQAPLAELLLNEVGQLLVVVLLWLAAVPAILLHLIVVTTALPPLATASAAVAIACWGLGLYVILLGWAVHTLADEEVELLTRSMQHG